MMQPRSGRGKWLGRLGAGRLWLVVATAAALCGCAGGGELTLRSLQNPDQQQVSRFSEGLYAFDDHNTLHVLLLEGPADHPAQVMDIRMLWQPRAGYTPMDPQATNCTVRRVVFSDSGVAVYAGAGLLFPRSKPGGESFQATLREIPLTLTDASRDFHAPMGLAMISGDFQVRRDDQRVNQLLRQMNVQVQQRLGYPRLVSARPIR